MPRRVSKHAAKATVFLLLLGTATSVLLAWWNAYAVQHWHWNSTAPAAPFDRVRVDDTAGRVYLCSLEARVFACERIAVSGEDDPRALSMYTQLRDHPEMHQQFDIADINEARAMFGPIPLPEPLLPLVLMNEGITRFYIAGWPLPCLYCRVGLGTADKPDVGALGHFFISRYRIPIAPLWPNFALDTAFFTAAWWSLLFAPRHARSAWRRRAGCCGRCGYSLAGLPPNSPCPECGKNR